MGLLTGITFNPQSKSERKNEKKEKKEKKENKRKRDEEAFVDFHQLTNEELRLSEQPSSPSQGEVVYLQRPDAARDDANTFDVLLSSVVKQDKTTQMATTCVLQGSIDLKPLCSGNDHAGATNKSAAQLLRDRLEAAGTGKVRCVLERSTILGIIYLPDIITIILLPHLTMLPMLKSCCRRW